MIKIIGVQAFGRSLARYAKKVPEETKNAIVSAGFAVEESAKRDAPVDLGALRASIKCRISDDGLVATITAGDPDAPYAPYVEFGTGGNVEIPKGWEDIAEQFKGKGVRQINIKAQPYLIGNFEKEEKALIKSLRELIRELP